LQLTEYFKPERDDRASLKAMLIALDASDTTLKRDVIRGEGRTGDWGIRGSTDRHDNDGNVIYSDGAGYVLYVTTDEPNEREPSSRPWSGAKAKLSFCRVTQDGDWEGCMYLDRLPAPHEAAAIRETLGIRKRRTITDEARAQLEANLKSTKSPKLDPPVR
jgi:hypothetical protein